MMSDHAYFTTLKNRGRLVLHNADRFSILQGLITQDIYKLETQDCVYACLLTPQGKFLYDFFVTQDGDSLVMDCEGGARLDGLEKLLKMYRLRADVQIEKQDSIPVYVGAGFAEGSDDPRHAAMGRRSYVMPDGVAEADFALWDTQRIALTVPDGSRDLIPQKSTMDEGRMDQLNAVDYNKGCYVGQELTARMHYRGLGKKHLRMVTLDELGLESFPACCTPLVIDGKTIGEMRSSCGDTGLVLIKNAA